LGDSPSGQRLRVPDAVLLSHLAQVLACLTLLVRVETCLNKLVVRDGGRKLIEVDRNAILRLNHLLREILSCGQGAVDLVFQVTPVGSISELSDGGV
ncbi:MAG: hypothetical protein WCD40_02735, partial [Candidatus Acidiferrales bacterium]